MEFFCDPAESLEWHGYWKQERLNWYYSLGVHPEHLRLRDHAKEELAHYSQATSDIDQVRSGCSIIARTAASTCSTDHDAVEPEVVVRRLGTLPHAVAAR